MGTAVSSGDVPVFGCLSDAERVAKCGNMQKHKKQFSGRRHVMYYGGSLVKEI